MPWYMAQKLYRRFKHVHHLFLPYFDILSFKSCVHRRLDCSRLSHTPLFISHRILKFECIIYSGYFSFFSFFFLMGIISEQNKFTSNRFTWLFLVYCFVCHRWNNNGEAIYNLLHERKEKLFSLHTQCYRCIASNTIESTIEHYATKKNGIYSFLFFFFWFWAKQNPK